MNVLITLGVIVVVALIVALVFVRVTRKPGDESPKRRELKTAKLRALAAQHAMNDLESIFRRYDKFVGGDDVALAFVDDINKRISQYRTETLELDK